MNSKKTTLIIALVAAMIIIPLATLAIGIYKYEWKDQFVLQSAEIIPYPAALVNWQNIKYSDWMGNVKDLNYFYAQQKDLEMNLVPVPSAEEIKTNELDRLIDVALLMEIAKEYNVTVTEKEVDTEFQTTILPQATGGEEEIVKTLNELYGWTLDEFKEKIIKEVVYRSKINVALGQEDVQDDKKTQTEEILSKINSGELTFEDAAKQYSEDSSAAQGGDLGFFPKGVMVTNFENAAFGLEVGETSEVIRTTFGYHIIKVEEKKTEEDQEQIHARHILIKLKSVDDLIKEKKESANIKKFF